jgi:hypothetical protein
MNYPVVNLSAIFATKKTFFQRLSTQPREYLTRTLVSPRTGLFPLLTFVEHNVCHLEKSDSRPHFSPMFRITAIDMREGTDRFDRPTGLPQSMIAIKHSNIYSNVSPKYFM